MTLSADSLVEQYQRKVGAGTVMDLVKGWGKQDEWRSETERPKQLAAKIYGLVKSAGMKFAGWIGGPSYKDDYIEPSALFLVVPPEGMEFKDAVRALEGLIGRGVKVKVNPPGHWTKDPAALVVEVGR